MKVTFDTNTFDKAVRPNRYPNDLDNAHFVRVHEAIRRGQIEGFICETMITLEGIKVDDRATVFGTSVLSSQIMPEKSGSPIRVNLKMEQPLRQPLHPKQAERITAALDLGLKLLGAPRVGMSRVVIPDSNPYAVENETELSERLDRYHNIATAIEDRDLGSAQAWQLAQRFAGSGLPSSPWFKILGMARDIHEKREVARAVAEWADADSVAAHYGYANNVFCTEDKGASAHESILHPDNRAWLTTTYGICFATLRELALTL